MGYASCHRLHGHCELVRRTPAPRAHPMRPGLSHPPRSRHAAPPDPPRHAVEAPFETRTLGGRPDPFAARCVPSNPTCTADNSASWPFWGVVEGAVGPSPTRVPGWGVRVAEKGMFAGHPDRGSERPVLLGISDLKRRKVRGVFGPGTAGAWIGGRPGPSRPPGWTTPRPWPAGSER